MQKILWITARLPHPLLSGDALYTASLVRSAHAAGMAVTVIGLTRGEDTTLDELAKVAPVEWVPVAESPIPAWRSLGSSLPKDAFALFPPLFAERLAELLRRDWDWIVFDHARSAGALDLVKARSRARIAYLAQNVEGKIRREIAAEMGSGIIRLAYVLDAEKYRRLENRLIKASDAVLAITEEDAQVFRASGAVAHHLPPAYISHKTEARTLGPETPRRVMVLGSFDWGAKQKNLERFLATCAPRLAAAKIGVDIVGSMPPALRDWISTTFPEIRTHGRVIDVTPLLDGVRGGVIPEELGGGMKIKALDYIFSRLPVFTLTPGVAGLPTAARNATFVARDFNELGDVIVANIDDLDGLNACQQRAFDACSERFSITEIASVLAAALAPRDDAAARSYASN